MRKIRNPLTGSRSDIVIVLAMLCAQDGCDGEPYDQMMEAAEYISDLRSENQALREALEAVVRGHEWLANIADLQNMPRPEWYNKAQAALKLVRGT